MWKQTFSIVFLVISTQKQLKTEEIELKVSINTNNDICGDLDILLFVDLIIFADKLLIINY